MSKIITTTERKRHLVLTDNQNKIMAVIAVETGESNITEKLSQAIREDLDCEKAVIASNIIIAEWDHEADFTADIYDEHDGFYTETFFLTGAELY